MPLFFFVTNFNPNKGNHILLMPFFIDYLIIKEKINLFINESMIWRQTRSFYYGVKLYIFKNITVFTDTLRTLVLKLRDLLP